MATPQPKILVIDDDESIRASFTDYLGDMGFRVFTAHNGRAGVEILDKERIDLVIVDIRMPEMDGLQVLDRITRTAPDTPVIVVSGTAEVADVVDALHKGACDYLLKPIDRMSILTRAIESALEKFRLKRENRRYQQHLEQMVAERTAALEEANDRLREIQQQLVRIQQLEAIATLAGGLAHDFNNILSSVIGYTEIALDDELPVDTPAKSSLEKVLKASLRARNLVKQILTFSRQTETQREAISLVSILKEVLKLIRASLPATIDIHQDIIAKDNTIMGDPTQIHQVIMNLCTNAGYAMRKNGGILMVRLSSIECGPCAPALSPEMQPGPYLMLSVTDNGPGMTAFVQERVFDPFFTTKTKEEGAGLGLAVAHGIVKEHGGAIEVESFPGEGTTFRVYFPLVIESQSQG
ncbi:MAG: hypothetical protein CR984_03590 [Proteobacteria bacterium]|nr:MAG: hypothetical protein CR984_03590 [Pseudomonadota bacterium]